MQRKARATFASVEILVILPITFVFEILIQSGTQLNRIAPWTVLFALSILVQTSKWAPYTLLSLNITVLYLSPTYVRKIEHLSESGSLIGYLVAIRASHTSVCVFGVRISFWRRLVACVTALQVRLDDWVGDTE